MVMDIVNLVKYFSEITAVNAHKHIVLNAKPTHYLNYLYVYHKHV